MRSAQAWIHGSRSAAFPDFNFGEGQNRGGEFGVELDRFGEVRFRSFHILTAPNTTGGAGFVGDYDGLVPTGASFGSAFVMAQPIATTGPTDLFFNTAP